MWIIRIIFLVLGLWLLREILRRFFGLSNRMSEKIRSRKEESDTPVPRNRVRDAEFEDLDDGDRGGGGQP